MAKGDSDAANKGQVCTNRVSPYAHRMMLPALIQERRLYGMGLRLTGVAALSVMMALIKLVGDRGVVLGEIMFWRQGFAVPVILLWVMIGPGLATLRTKRFGAHAKRATFGLTAMLLNFWSILLLPLAEATTFGYTVPLFATLLSALVLKERVRLHRWSAVALGFVGVLIVAQPGSGHIPLAGAAAGLSAAALVGLVSIQIRELTRTDPPATIAFWFSLISCVPLFPFLLWTQTPHDGETWALLAGIGILGGLGQIAITSSLKYAPVSTVISMDYSSLIWASLAGWLIWNQLPSDATWIGAPVIIASGLYIAWREHKLAIARAQEIAA